ncbi:MAG: hypothetical protein D3M94_22305 [Rhodocyclales bacterium GT-UBC]|nr:MAG: hypothetical protein D3M94_22305 [Rhodocyclales bacterium GT-UBC]
MPILKRFHYALVVLIAVTMVVMLTLSIGEGLGLTYGVDVQRLTSHPLYVISVYLVGFVTAPWLSERMLISGDPTDPSPNGKAPFGYAARILALAALCLVLVLLTNLVVFLLGKFA